MTGLKVAMVERTMSVCRPVFDPTTTRQASQSAVEMSPQMKRVLRFFDEYVFGFMRSDIDAAIRGNANYLCALGLVSYTETLGGLVTGNLALRKYSGANFRAFLPYLGAEYQAFKARGIDIYDVVRCGLVHEYFIKGGPPVWTRARGSCGIISSPGGPTHFIVEDYRDHFFAGATQYRNDLLGGAKKHLTENFEKGIKRIGISI